MNRTILSHFFRITLLLVTVGGLPAAATSAPCERRSAGAFAYRTQSPFPMLHHLGVPDVSRQREVDKVEVGVGFQWANVIGRDNMLETYVVDYESLFSEIRVGWQPSPKWQLDLELGHAQRFGGVLDHLSIEVHEIFGFTVGVRELVPEDDFNVRLDGDERGGIRLLEEDRGGFLDRVGVRAQRELSCHAGKHFDRKVVASAGAAVQQRTISRVNPWSSTGLDLSVAGGISWVGGLIGFQVSGAVSYVNKPKIGTIDLRETVVALGLVTELKMTSRHSLLLQLLASQSPLDGFGPYGQVSTELLFGWKGRLGERILMEAAVIENVFVHPNSPDFGFHAGVTTRF